jgi:hypothetical protein
MEGRTTVSVTDKIDALLLQLEVCAADGCSNKLDRTTNSGMFCSEEHQHTWQFSRSHSELDSNDESSAVRITDGQATYFLASCIGVETAWQRAQNAPVLFVGGVLHGTLRAVPDVHSGAIFRVAIPVTPMRLVELADPYEYVVPVESVTYHARLAVFSERSDPRAVETQTIFVAMAMLGTSNEQLADAVRQHRLS